MNATNLKLAANLIDATYVEMGGESIKTRENQIKALLSQRALPDEGWDDLSIEKFLCDLAVMDTNNFMNKAGVGERESRVFSSLVSKRHFYMGHGIGRSGEVNAVQPKAAGSSIVLKLAKALTYDALKTMNYDFVQDLVLLPLATGMALTSTLLAAASQNPGAKFVLWPRIDQKTCLKCIPAALLTPVVVEEVLEGDELRTNLKDLEEKIVALGGKEKVLAVLSTTSCFAPRVPDSIEEIAALCKKHEIFHIVNNAYGLQCSKIAYAINQGSKHGRIDAVIQSTDKNFLVPVGGSIVFSPPGGKLVEKISSMYPGRASGSPIMDLFLTFLSMGKKGLKKFLQTRKDNVAYMKEKLTALAGKHGERVLNLPSNTISFAMTLTGLSKFVQDHGAPAAIITELGSKLFLKRVMGTRVIAASKAKEVAGLKFANYGSHANDYPNMPYITAAVSIGQEKEEIDLFIERLDKSIEEFKKECLKAHKDQVTPPVAAKEKEAKPTEKAAKPSKEAAQKEAPKAEVEGEQMKKSEEEKGDEPEKVATQGK